MALLQTGIPTALTDDRKNEPQLIRRSFIGARISCHASRTWSWITIRYNVKAMTDASLGTSCMTRETERRGFFLLCVWCVVKMCVLEYKINGNVRQKRTAKREIEHGFIQNLWFFLSWCSGRTALQWRSKAGPLAWLLTLAGCRCLF